MLLKNLFGKAVIELEEGTEIAEVKSLLLNRKNHSIKYVLLQPICEKFFEEMEIIPITKIMGIGNYAITVSNRKDIKRLLDVVDNPEDYKDLMDVMGEKVINENGDLIGEVTDLLVDEDAACLVGIEVSSEGEFKPINIFAENIKVFGKRTVIVNKAPKESYSIKSLLSIEEEPEDLLENSGIGEFSVIDEMKGATGISSFDEMKDDNGISSFDEVNGNNEISSFDEMKGDTGISSFDEMEDISEIDEIPDIDGVSDIQKELMDLESSSFKEELPIETEISEDEGLSLEREFSLNDIKEENDIEESPLEPDDLSDEMNQVSELALDDGFMSEDDLNTDNGLGFEDALGLDNELNLEDSFVSESELALDEIPNLDGDFNEEFSENLGDSLDSQSDELNLEEEYFGENKGNFQELAEENSKPQEAFQWERVKQEKDEKFSDNELREDFYLKPRDVQSSGSKTLYSDTSSYDSNKRDTVRQFINQQKKILPGKIATRDILLSDGQVLIQKGNVITQDIFEKAEKDSEGNIVEMAMFSE